MENRGSQLSRLQEFTRYFFKCPPSKHLFFVMLAAALLFPVAGNDLFSKTGYFIFLIVPAFLTSVLGWKTVKWLGGKFEDKHAYFLSTLTMFGVAILLAAVSFIDNFYIFEIWNVVEILFIGLAAVFMFHLLVYAAVGVISIYKAVAPASLYLLFSALILLSFRTVTPKMLGRLGTLVGISFFIVWVFIKLTDAPFKSTLGITTFDLVSLSIAEYVHTGGSDKNPFSGMGKDLKVPYQVLKFQTKKSKYAIAVPWLHPGPIESIGGKLPNLLAENLKKKLSDAVFLHTYVDHTFNPVSLDRITGQMRNMTFSGKGFSKSARATRLVQVRNNGTTLLGQKFGNAYLFISTFAPKVTEDISPAVGFWLLRKFGRNAIFVDAHNSFSREIDEAEAIGFGDARVENLIAAIEIARKKLDRERQAPFKVSIESSGRDFLEFGVKGISVFCTEVRRQKNAVIVLDTNNLVPEFRERIIKKVKQAGFNNAEVVTTDAHLGDFVVKMYGLTGRLGAEQLEKEILGLVDTAGKNLESGRVSYLCADINARVFGEKMFHQLIATANSLIPFAKFLALTLITAFLLAAYVVLQF